MSNFSELDDMMGYNALNTDIFAKPATNAGNPNIYRTNPKDTKTKEEFHHLRESGLLSSHMRSELFYFVHLFSLL